MFKSFDDSNLEQMAHYSRIERKLNGLANSVEQALENYNRTYPNLKIFNMDYAPDYPNMVIGLTALDLTQKETKKFLDHKGVKANIPYHLDEKMSFNLEKACDAIHTIKMLLLPGEKLRKATLFSKCSYPKDLEEQKKWLKGMKTDQNLNPYGNEDFITRWCPIRIVYPTSNSFTFFDNPFQIVGCHWNEFSVELEITSLQTDYNRMILIESFLYDLKLRKETGVRALEMVYGIKTQE